MINEPIRLLYIARCQKTCKIGWIMFIHLLTWCQASVGVFLRHLHLMKIIKSNLDQINHKIYRLFGHTVHGNILIYNIESFSSYLDYNELRSQYE